MKDINHLLDDVELQQKRHQRFYLGISQIGNPNQRLLWMRWRWLMPEDMPARVLRLLDLGNVVEDDLIKKLRKIPGAQIFDVASNGKQFETETLGGHVKGHIDGVGQNFPGIDTKDPFLLEFKTANDNRFNNLVKLGSYCEWSEDISKYMPKNYFHKSELLAFNKCYYKGLKNNLGGIYLIQPDSTSGMILSLGTEDWCLYKNQIKFLCKIII